MKARIVDILLHEPYVVVHITTPEQMPIDGLSTTNYRASGTNGRLDFSLLPTYCDSYNLTMQNVVKVQAAAIGYEECPCLVIKLNWLDA